MTRIIALCLLLSACASDAPGWTEVTMVKIPRLGGGNCYVERPKTVWSWIIQYSAMVHECARGSEIIEATPEEGT